MSRDRVRPLVAFALVSLLCAFVLVQGMRQPSPRHVYVGERVPVPQEQLQVRAGDLLGQEPLKVAGTSLIAALEGGTVEVVPVTRTAAPAPAPRLNGVRDRSDPTVRSSPTKVRHIVGGHRHSGHTSTKPPAKRPPRTHGPGHHVGPPPGHGSGHGPGRAKGHGHPAPGGGAAKRLASGPTKAHGNQGGRNGRHGQRARAHHGHAGSHGHHGHGRWV